MRTLKKSLALVLALVMVLGLGVIGASADNALDNYTDASEIGDAYYEAVGVLTGLGIIDGMTETTIEPTGTYTREQAAKIIATMVLGVKNAESLTCVEAPFDDVPADRWSAGYIAFCVEQGIIDGMTDTTFEPTGTLTGFQWAKMLLAAVGFGANGEFTGTSWSLNTARVAHEAGLFDGDLSGADHVNLSRQQAALYAFNTLTEIKQVTYTSNANNYVYGIRGYWFADGTGKTLGWSVFDLRSVEGQIIDNEGMGASLTYVDNVNESEFNPNDEVIKVDADTGLDLMYHAVRLWYVNGKTNDGVFTYDLAKTTNYDCTNLSDGTKAATKNKAAMEEIGQKGTPYEGALIDNTALDLGYSYVTFYYTLGTVGITSEAKDTTVIVAFGARPAVSNNDILTDMSEMEYGEEVIVLKATSELEDDDDVAYYVYAETTTSGTVKSVDKNGVVTLRDDTKIPASTLLKNNVRIDTSETYTFVLDTHGHYINAVISRNLVYYTGAYKVTPGTYNGEQTYEAQVISTDDGTISDVTVLGRWIWGHNDLIGIAEAVPGYYVLGEPTGDGFYRPQSWLYNNIDVANKEYVADANLTGKTTKLAGMDIDIDEVEFIVATGRGTSADSETVVGLDNLLDAVGDAASSSILLANMAVTYETTEFGNRNITKIFVPNFVFRSTYLFVPHAIDGPDYREEMASGAIGYHYTDGIYLNGTNEEVNVVLRNNQSIARGFYSYTVDADGFYALAKVNPHEWNYENQNIGRRGSSTYYQWSAEDGKEYVFADDVIVFDARSGVPEEVDAISALNELIYGQQDPQEPLAQLAYTFNGNGDIAVVYITDENLGGVELTMNIDGLTFGNGYNTVKVYEDDVVTIVGEGVNNLVNGTKVTVNFTDKNYNKPEQAPATVVVDENGNHYISLDVAEVANNGEKVSNVEITSVTYDVTLVNEATNFTTHYEKGAWTGVGTEFASGKTITLNVGQTLNVALIRDTIAQGITATVVLDGAKTAENTVVTDDGHLWVKDIVVTGNKLTIKSATATFGFTLVDGDSAKNHSFIKGDTNANADKKSVSAELGAEIDVVIYRTAGPVAEGNMNKCLVINNTVYSEETAAEANNVFTFKLIPSANETNVSLSWWEETETSDPAV